LLSLFFLIEKNIRDKGVVITATPPTTKQTFYTPHVPIKVRNKSPEYVTPRYGKYVVLKKHEKKFKSIIIYLHTL